MLCSVVGISVYTPIKKKNRRGVESPSPVGPPRYKEVGCQRIKTAQQYIPVWKINIRMPDFENKVFAELTKRFTKAGIYYVSKLRGYLNVSQPYKRSRTTGRHRGLSPSRPGQYPKKLSGQLQRSMTWTLDKSKLVLTCGSNLAGYPSFLQTGTRFMRPRPWLSLSWQAERGKIGKIIVG